MPIHNYRVREREGEGEREIQTDRQTDRECVCVGGESSLIASHSYLPTGFASGHHGVKCTKIEV